MYEQSGEHYFGSFACGDHGDPFQAVAPSADGQPGCQFASWKDMIDAAVTKTDALREETVEPAASAIGEPAAPGTDPVGDNARAILLDTMLGDAVQQIQKEDYCAATRDLSLALRLDENSNDAKFLFAAVDNRVRVLALCLLAVQVKDEIRESIARASACVLGFLPALWNRLWCRSKEKTLAEVHSLPELKVSLSTYNNCPTRTLSRRRSAVKRSG